jgi:phosphate transporter
VERAEPFQRSSKDRLGEAIAKIVDLYARCVTRGDKRMALQQLKLQQRENIAWERDTVWRQMIAQQRRGDLEDEPTAIGALYRSPGPGLFYIPTPLGTIRVTKKMIYKIIAGIIFVILLNVEVVEKVEANRCFAILMLCTFLWATEVCELSVALRTWLIAD